MENVKHNPVNWFEIAAKDLERAKAFYAEVLQADFQYLEMPNSKMYMFAGDPTKPGSMGAIVSGENIEPNAAGTTIYFDCEDLANEESRIEKAGGTIIFPKTSIGEFGFIAQFMDTEGNRLGLHSSK